MKTNTALATLAGFLIWISADGQGTFIYDQQSATSDSGGEGAGAINSLQPLGQSFTPGLSTVGFIRLQLADGIPGNGLGAVLYVNLRTNSITGAILGSSDPVFLRNSFGVFGNTPFTNFFFSTPVPVTPGATYFLQPVIQSGDTNGFDIIGANPFPGYAGGVAFYNGVAAPNNDLWFREGIFIPEPSAVSLILVAGGCVALAVLRKHADK